MMKLVSLLLTGRKLMQYYIVLHLVVGGYLIANMAARLDCTDLSDMFLI